MEQSEFDNLKPELQSMYNRGLADSDAKLDEALIALKRGNDSLESTTKLLRRALQERDAILEEYARVSWSQACQGLMAAGFHHPGKHAVGAPPCKRCNSNLTKWDALALDVREAKMKKVWSAVMQVRGKRLLEPANDHKIDIKNAPTTHDLGGVAQRIMDKIDAAQNEPKPEGT